MTGVPVAIRTAAGEVLGSLLITRLPSRSDRLLLDDASGRAEVSEGGEYGFRIDLGEEELLVEPSSELLSFDDSTRRTGRFYPRQHVGTIRFAISEPRTSRLGWAEIDVRPTKLDAETEYRQMLSDIEDVATEALLQGFAPASLSLRTDPAKSAELLYQQFALLYAKLRSSRFQDAMALIVANPNRAWLVETEGQHPGRPVRGHGNLVRALTRSGPRVPTHGRLSVPSVPRRVEHLRTESTIDSIPNQFVRYALTRWRGIAQRLADSLDAIGPETGPVRRGREAARDVLAQVDAYLAAPLFREVSRLGHFPTSNQVLLKQAGYRDIFRTFALAELGGRVALHVEIDDLFAASQRNLAALYEYWAFLQLADAVGQVCGSRKSIQALQVADDGLSWSFRQGPQSGLQWRLERDGREFAIKLFFNRTFLASAEWRVNASWSRPMRPDCSLHIHPLSRVPQLTDPRDMDLWLHFDAKYRVQYAQEQFDPSLALGEESASDAEKAERIGRSKREDLLKMHAYRDAIRGSAGAYVLFPGTTTRQNFRQFSEVLPGLGAFVLRPSQDPERSGVRELERFLSSVIGHAADRATQHERARYWTAEVRRTEEQGSATGSDLPDIRMPPRDSIVLCGYVRNLAHQRWVAQTGLYNVRADSRRGALSPDALELRADWLLLYGPQTTVTLWRRDGAWFVQTRERLLELGYPNPRGDAYLCCPVAPEPASPDWIGELDLNELRPSQQPIGHPYAVSWAELLAVRARLE